MTERLRSLLQVLYGVLPKGRYAVLWGWPDYEDSVLALEQELQGSSVRRVVLLMTDRRAPPPVPLGPKTVRVGKSSPAGWVAFAFARYVFFTHRCFMRRFPPNVVSVNVWHGMPIKRIGWLLEGDEGIESRHVLATSPFWADIMERAMRPSGEVLTTGLPRNDRLFADRAPVWRALRLDERSDADRLVIWLPTYRRSVRGMRTIDGRPAGSVFEMDVDPVTFNAFLAEQRTMAIVKPHPMAAFDGVQEHSHLLVVDDAWLRARSLSLYQLLGASDVLVSDVSSATVDYLLLDRPVVHALADLTEYGNSRGFTVDSVEELLMGPVATDQDEVLAVLREVLDGRDPDGYRRERMRARSHTDLDGGAARRLVEALGLL